MILAPFASEMRIAGCELRIIKKSGNPQSEFLN